MGRQSVRVSELSTHENAELRRGRDAKSRQGQTRSSRPKLLPEVTMQALGKEQHGSTRICCTLSADVRNPQEASCAGGSMMKDKEPFEDSKRPCRAPRQQDKEPQSAEISFPFWEDVALCASVVLGLMPPTSQDVIWAILFYVLAGSYGWRPRQRQSHRQEQSQRDRQTDRPTDRPPQPQTQAPG